MCVLCVCVCVCVTWCPVLEALSKPVSSFALWKREWLPGRPLLGVLAGRDVGLTSAASMAGAAALAAPSAGGGTSRWCRELAGSEAGRLCPGRANAAGTPAGSCSRGGCCQLLNPFYF